MDTALLVSLGALVLSGLSAYYAWMSSQRAHEANQLTVLADFLREFRELEPDRRRVIRDLPNVETVWISDLSDPLRESATHVCWYLDGLGLLVGQGLVDEDALFTIIGSPTVRLWGILAPFIEAERDHRTEPIYMRGFEDLAERARKHDYASAMEKLKRFNCAP